MLKTIGNPASRTGDQTIVAGNLVIGTAGKGIDFSADPSPAGMTSELLDDYEEGTFTPGFSFGGGTTGIAYSAQQVGYYTKVGNIVHVTGICELTNKGSSTGSASLTGLPFTIANNNAAYSAGSLRFGNITYLGMMISLAAINTTQMPLEQVEENGNRGSLTNANFSNNSFVIFELTYRVA